MTFKRTRSLKIAMMIQEEIGGGIHPIRAKVAGIIFANPSLTDEEVAFVFASQNTND
jgi:hypothetical protein